MALTAATQGPNRPRGSGALLTYTGTNPAAGVECSDAVPAGKVWRLLAVAHTLVTDATVSNRKVRVALDDGTNVFWRGYAAGNTAQTASSTNLHSFALGVPGTTLADGTDTFIGPLPDLYLGSGFNVKTTTTNLQAGDNYGAPVYFVEEWNA